MPDSPPKVAISKPTWRQRPDVPLSEFRVAATGARATESVDLYRGMANLEWEATGKTESGHLTLRLHWLPTPSVNVDLGETEDDSEPRAGYVRIRLPGIDGSLRALIRHHTFVDTTKMPRSTKGLPYIPSGWLEGGELGVGPLTNVECGIVNLPSIQEALQEDGGTRWRWQVMEGPLDLSWDAWQLVLTPRPHEEAWGKAGHWSGVAITHTARLARADGASFDASHGRLILDGLRTLLTFARGERTSPGLVFGVNESGEHWSRWDLDEVDPLHGTDFPSDTWLGEDHAGALRRIVPGWMRLWSDEGWRQRLDLAVALRVDAASRRSDVGIVVAQQALEQLAWAVLVEEEAVLSRDGFGKLPASDRIRLALASAGVALTLPEYLHRRRESREYEDGPHAVTSIRNGLVHPSAAGRIPSAVREHIDDWLQLALLYVDLLVLDLVGYELDESGGMSNSTAES